MGPVRLLALALSIAAPAVAQCSALSLSPPGTDLQLGDDDVRTVGLGFAFPFDTETYTTISVAANGFVWLGTVTPALLQFVLFFATLVLFIASWKDLRRAMIMTFGDRVSRLRTLRILNDIEKHLGDYLITVTMINAGVGVATGLICVITGMPNAAGLGALATTLNYIPIVGPVAMFAVLVVVGIAAFPTLSGGMAAPLLFVVLTFFEGHFITPTIIGRRLALNALAVLLTLAFWTWLWGPMGSFLSAPLLIVALILKEHLMPVETPHLPED